MILTKNELIHSLQNEIRILLHLISKVTPEQREYRPTDKQRSTLELLRYLAIMGPTQLQSIAQGNFTREAMMAVWGPAEERSKAMTFEDAVAAIEAQSAQYAEVIGAWGDEEFRRELDVFGQKWSVGSMVVNMMLGAHAAYRMQVFLYLKQSGRPELNTMNLWMGVDGVM